MRIDHRRLLNEAPTVVGMLTSTIETGGSLDTAARTIMTEGPIHSRPLFSEAIRSVDTKCSRDISEALTSILGRLPDEASGYRQAIMLCISASDASDQAERIRILREASDVALDAVRIMGERYSASLSTPCMVVFGLGIMAPMIIMSILPMLSIGGLFGSMPIDSDLIVLVTLVAIPAIILAISIWIRSGNPFLDSDHLFDGSISCISLLVAVPLYALMLDQGRPSEESILLSVLPACVVCLMLLWDGRRRDSRRARSESGLRDCIFEVGNTLLGGDNFEKVVVDVISSRPECFEVGTALSREMDLCRGDVGSAIDLALAPVSGEVSRTLRDVHRCSLTDTEDAGRLAIAMGRQFQNGSNIRKELDLRLKSMMDMMTGTAVLFAPMVLGMSMSMLDPLSEISGYQGMEDTGLILSIYIVELCLLISVLTSSLGGGEGVRGILWKFSLMAPLALLVFGVCIGMEL